MMRSWAALSVFAATMFLVVLTHCDRGPTGPAGPKLTGSITGFVILVKSNGAQPARRDSVTVTLDGTSLRAITDSTGEWSIPDVETGIYNLTIARTGYSTTKLVQVQFTGGASKDVGTIYLCQVPNFSVKTLYQISPLRTDSATVHLGVQLTDSTISGPYMPYRVFLFLGADTTVSSDPQHYQSVLSYTMSFQNGIDSTTIKLTPSTLSTSGYAAGDRIFVVAYVANAGNNNSTYLDPSTGRTIYTNLNASPSNIVKIIVASDTTGPAGTGLISGIVTLVNANGFQPEQRDSVLVSIDGTPFSAITDSAGAWSIPNLGTGTFNFSFTKPGYATARVLQLSFGGGSRSLGTINLCQPPSFNVADLWRWVAADTTKIRLGIKLNDTTISDPNVPYRVFLFLGSDSSVSSNPSHYWSIWTNAMAFKNGIDSTTISLAAPGLANDGFVEGDTLYIAAYAANAGSANSSYTDPATGRAVYVNINPVRSNVIKVVIP